MLSGRRTTRPCRPGCRCGRSPRASAIAVLGSGLALLNYAFDEIANPALRPVKSRLKVKPAQSVKVKAAAAPRAEVTPA